MNKGGEIVGMFDDLTEKFTELEDGRYVVRIDGFTREKTINDLRPIRWELTLLSDVKGRLPAKFSHVDTDGGFRILMEELKRLGFSKPKSPAELEAILTELIGSFVEVGLFTTDKREGYREIRFIRNVR